MEFGSTRRSGFGDDDDDDDELEDCGKLLEFGLEPSNPVADPGNGGNGTNDNCGGP